MSKPNYKPVPRVRMTLTSSVQNRVLQQLLTAFGISETFNQKMEITCFPSDFATFMALLAKTDKPPTIKQLQMEHVDVRRDVQRISVSQRGIAGLFGEPEDETYEEAEALPTVVASEPATGSHIAAELLMQAQPKVLNLGALPNAVAATARNLRGYLVPEHELNAIQLSLRFPEGHPRFVKELWQSRSMSLPAVNYWEWVQTKVWDAQP